MARPKLSGSRMDRQLERDVCELVRRVTGLRDEADPNFQLALDFAWSNFRFHRFLDVNSHKVEKTIEGIYEKFTIHSDLSKAASWKRLTTEFLNASLPSVEKIKTDAHYSILSLLLCLSDSPSNSSYVETPRNKEVEKKDDFDWGKYLMEGEEIGLGPNADSPNWSEDSDDEDTQQPLSREDSGIQVDRTPLDEQDHSRKGGSQVCWEDEPDSQSWLEQHVVHQYWTTRRSRIPHSVHLHSNLAAVWDQHLYSSDPLYVPDDRVVVTETQVIRETLWLLSGVKKLFIFQLIDGKVTVRNNIIVTHLTHSCLRSVLEQIAAYGQVVFRLQEFIDEVMGHSSEILPPGNGSIPKKPPEAPFRTYQAFMWALYKYFINFKEELTEIEKCIISSDTTITLATVVNKLAPRLAQLKVLHKVFSTGVAEVPPDTRNVVRASHLLNTLYKAILEYDNVGEASEQTLRLQHGEDSTPHILTEQQATKENLIKMQSIAERHLELDDIHDPLLAINFASLSISFENVDTTKKKLPVHTLDGLTLSYKVPWPVDIVISVECQKIYNQVFLLLLQIKWAKYSLDVLLFGELANAAERSQGKEDNLCEEDTLSQFGPPKESLRQQIHRMFLLRVKLMHFVNSLHNYIMTRILHSTGLEFQHQVEEAKDLDQLIKIHYRYLSTIHDRCLLREKVSFVKEAIMKVLNLALMFAEGWQAGLGAWHLNRGPSNQGKLLGLVSLAGWSCDSILSQPTGGAHPANPGFLCCGDLSGGRQAGLRRGQLGGPRGRKARAEGPGAKAANGWREERREEGAEPRSTAPEEGEEAGCFLVHSRPAQVTHWGRKTPRSALDNRRRRRPGKGGRRAAGPRFPSRPVGRACRRPRRSLRELLGLPGLPSGLWSLRVTARRLRAQDSRPSSAAPGSLPGITFRNPETAGSPVLIAQSLCGAQLPWLSPQVQNPRTPELPP
ncbi:tubulin gamma complex associated protein 5 [Cricetulus griseus]